LTLVQGRRGWFTALCIALLATLCIMAARPAHADTQIQNAAQGDDTTAIEDALAAESGTASAPGRVTLSASGDCSNMYMIDSSIDIPNNVILESNVDGAQACIGRTNTPGPGNSAQFHWFNNEDNSVVNNFTMRDIQLRGQGVGAPTEAQHSYADSGLTIIPSSGLTYSDPNTYGNNLTLNNVTFFRMYGVCSMIEFTRNITFNDVDCDNPSKGGLMFRSGSRNVDVTNTTVSLANDDGIALTTGQNNYTGSRVQRAYDITVSGSSFTQDLAGSSYTTGNVVALRGPQLVDFNNNYVGPGNAGGSVWATRSADDPNGNNVGSLATTDTDIHDNEIHAADTKSGVYVAAGSGVGTDGIKVRLNDIYYNDNPGCGVKRQTTGDFATAAGAVQLGTNYFHPSSAHWNYCP
jgi:hypothetical protein